LVQAVNHAMTTIRRTSPSLFFNTWKRSNIGSV